MTLEELGYNEKFESFRREQKLLRGANRFHETGISSHST